MNRAPTTDLDRIRVAAPCTESWADMAGDERQRFCDRCALHVYDLSGLTRPEATELVSGAEGRLCVRFFRRSDGTVLTADCPVGLAARAFRRLRAVAVALIALVGLIPGCRRGELLQGSVCGPETVEGGGEMIMGDVAIVEEVGEVQDFDQVFLGELACPPDVPAGR